jgi:hypothetical protein
LRGTANTKGNSAKEPLGKGNIRHNFNSTNNSHNLRSGKPNSYRYNNHFISRRLIIKLAILGITGLMIYAAPRYPQVVETYYSRWFYPYIVGLLSWLSGLLPISLAEMVLALTGIGGGSYLLVQLWRIYRTREENTGGWLVRLQKWGRWGLGSLVVVSSLILGFLGIWGLNYHRQPLAKNLDLTLLPKNSALKMTALERACQVLINKVNVDYQLFNGSELNESTELTGSTKLADATNVNSATDVNNLKTTLLPMNRRTLNEILDEAYQQEPTLQGICAEVKTLAKPVYFSRVLSYLRIAGVYFPFTGEAHYNREQPDAALPFVIAHEKAHQRGIARESEANFVAFLVCQRARHPYVRYAGNLLSLDYLLVALAESNSPQAATIAKTLLAGPRRDRQAMRAFWRPYQGRLSTIAATANDAYLKANNVHNGVANYDEMVELVLAYYNKYD